MEVTSREFQDFIPFEKADVKAFLKDDQHKDAFRSFIEKHKPELKRFLEKCMPRMGIKDQVLLTLSLGWKMTVMTTRMMELIGGKNDPRNVTLRENL
jgi:hypothetical protein